MLAYRLAYLKVYYTKYFMTALLNNVISSEKKINEYKQELMNLGINLVKPDVNRSLSNLEYSKWYSIALTAIKNVGYRSGYEIVQDRVNFGPYLDIDDFLKRMNKKVDYQASRQSLVKAGALDTFGTIVQHLWKKVKDYYEDGP